MAKWISNMLFGDDLSSLPPAGSGRTQEWDGKEYNSTLSKVVGKDKGDKIRDADMISKEKYDEMDTHIQSLNELRDKLKEVNEKHKSAKKAKRKSKLDSDPE